MEDVISQDPKYHILKVEISDDKSNFDMWGNLMSAGKVEYWHFINDQMRKFDCNKTNLQPKAKSN